MTETERVYAYWLCSIPMIGGIRAGQLLARFGSPQAVYEAGTTGWKELLSDSIVEYMDTQKKNTSPIEEYQQMEKLQIQRVLGIRTFFGGRTGTASRKRENPGHQWHGARY